MKQRRDGSGGQGSAQPILRAPPFPGATVKAVSRFSRKSDREGISNLNLEECATAIRAARVGGTFWGAQVDLPHSKPIIARPISTAQAGDMLDHARQLSLLDRLVLWLPSNIDVDELGIGCPPVITGIHDPWHLFSQASSCWFEEADDNGLLARIAGLPIVRFGDGAPINPDEHESVLGEIDRIIVQNTDYIDPFLDRPSDVMSTISLLDYWRELIDSNRPIAAAAGFAHWKRGAVEPLLWGGVEPVRFMPATASALAAIPEDRSIAIWKSRVPPAFLDEVERQGRAVHEVEDGFIRSAGLGADCVPPLSIVVDRLGVHFDPSHPSELENILQNGKFTPEMLERAERLRKLIVETGVSKYGVGSNAMARPGGAKRHILVTGQVEDDRSVLQGGGAVQGNLDLLKRARAHEPDAYIIYKPHPDVEAGHRKGHVPENYALSYANIVIRDAPISALLDMVDGIHVLTSLAGFEALIRGKHVTTHGVPFYAGWGLTTDLGAIPSRRTAHRSVIEMVTAVLMLYPRYLDPVTALPCPPEILVHRLVAGIRKENWAIVSLRRLQGRVRHKLLSMRRAI